MTATTAPPTIRRRLFALALAATALVPAACSSDSDGDDKKADDKPAAESTAPGEETTTTGAENPVFASPEEASQALYDAWKADDEEAAVLAADPGAVMTLWAKPAGDYELAESGCVVEEGATRCPFESADGEPLDFMLGQRGQGWVVVSVP